MDHTANASGEITLQGTPVSRGIGIAPIHVIARGFNAPEVYRVRDTEAEKKRFVTALEKTKDQLLELQKRIESISGEKDSQIFEAHIMMLEDRAIVDKVNDAIDQRGQNAEFALYAVAQNFLEAMRRVPDPYLRERTADIEDVCQRVLRNFSQEDQRDSAPQEQHVLVAYDLSPSDTAAMNRQLLLGFATELGSVNSHTAILARALGIPAVVGIEGAVLAVKALTPAILDGYSGNSRFSLAVSFLSQVSR